MRVKEFGKGFASGVKDTVKFAGKVKKAVAGETLQALLDTLEEGAELDKFDAVLAYLIDEQLAEDFDDANKAMTSLSEELVDHIYEQQLQVVNEAQTAYEKARKAAARRAADRNAARRRGEMGGRMERETYTNEAGKRMHYKGYTARDGE